MKRRSFLKASLVTTSISGLTSAAAMASATNKKNTKQQWYELRAYTIKNDQQKQLVLDYWQHAAIPAYNKLGCKNIGVFTGLTPADTDNIYVLVPFSSLNDFVSVIDKLTTDDQYKQAGQKYLEAPAKEAAYERIESSLLKAFEAFPTLKVPEQKSRIFELRRYESSGEAAGAKKIDMFNNVGEISIFERVGLTPVFFGETMVGGLRPNLTYMLTFDDMAEHDKNWKAFGADAEWQRIKAIPGYEDASIVSRITRTFLQPASFSQV